MSTPLHSPLERIRRHLVGLKMPRALETLESTLARIEQGEVSALEAIETLLGEEFSTRETRRIKMTLMTARLTTIKTLAGYDFSFQPSLDRNRVLALAQLDFIERRQCVHFLGPPGTGKSHCDNGCSMAHERQRCQAAPHRTGMTPRLIGAPCERRCSCFGCLPSEGGAGLTTGDWPD